MSSRLQGKRRGSQQSVQNESNGGTRGRGRGRPSQSQPQSTNEASQNDPKTSKRLKKGRPTQQSLMSSFRGNEKFVISDEEVIELTNSTVCYFITTMSTKCPVSRNELMKSVFINHNSKYYCPVLTETAECLSEVFGLRLTPVDEKPVGRSDKYILVNSDGTPTNYIEVEEPDEKAHQVLLCIILCCISMNGGTILEDALHEFLMEMDVKPQDSSNSGFGNIPMRLATYKSQLYLKYEMDKNVNPPVMCVKWGARAYAEINKGEMQKFGKMLYPEVPNSCILMKMQMRDEESGSEFAEEREQDDDEKGRDEDEESSEEEEDGSEGEQDG